jgi:hypothetical protein
MQTALTSLCAITPISVALIRKGWTPRSMRRVMELEASDLLQTGYQGENPYRFPSFKYDSIIEKFI